LRPTGHAAFLAMAFHIARDGLLEFLHPDGTLRPRPHQTHMPKQDVDQLRDLVPVGMAHDTANTRHTRVIFLRPAGAMRLSIFTHGAEFDHRERTTVEAHALLRVED